MSDEGSGTFDKEKILQDLLDEQNRFDQQFRDHQATLNEQTKRMQGQIFNQLGKGRSITPEVQEIATLLMSQPLLIPPVKKFIQDKLVKIEQAVQGIVNE